MCAIFALVEGRRTDPAVAGLNQLHEKSKILNRGGRGGLELAEKFSW
jgi:hypothetical protein